MRPLLFLDMTLDIVEARKSKERQQWSTERRQVEAVKMAAAGNGLNFHFHSPYAQGDQEEILPPAQGQSSLTSPENIVIPIHPPLIINLNNEEDDEEEDNEENYVSDWAPKTAEDIKEERAIKEICYKSESHTAETNAQPSYQPKGHCKDGENNSLPDVREPGRKAYCHSSEPRRSAYVVYRTVTVTQEPKFSRPRVDCGPAGRICDLCLKTDKYTSGSYNAPTWSRRNPEAKTFSKTKTTIQAKAEVSRNSASTDGLLKQTLMSLPAVKRSLEVVKELKLNSLWLYFGGQCREL
ncbi:hypothetical protein AAES_162583 [Amazona aestiva]|uniref:Uncharacterized protein n=1 Tax=Amazona aestiva TaxID=12930 RepID=A0A0Q3P0I6_AMAAE|nr:hypothetical protein AAES_162583 [Amazona aestiva]